MFNIFEQPFTLLGLAVLVLFGVMTYRSFCPENRHWRQWLLPLFVAGSAMSADLLVQTDYEKVMSVIKTGMRAIEKNDCDKIAAIIAEDYFDSYHKTKDGLIAHCRKILPQALVNKCKKTACLVELSLPKATVTLFAILTFDKNSTVSQNYKSFIMIKVRLNLQKQPSNTWLIDQIDLLEIDKQPFNWNSVVI
jgi:hypothetical protein